MTTKAKLIQAINKQILAVKENTRKKLRVLQGNIAKLKEGLSSVSTDQRKRVDVTLRNLRHSVRKLRTARDSAILSLEKRKEQIYAKASTIEEKPMKSLIVANLIEVAAGRTQEWFDNLKPSDQKKYLKEHPSSKFGQKKAGPTAKKTPAAKTAPAKPARVTIKSLNESLQGVADEIDTLKKKRIASKNSSVQEKISARIAELQKSARSMRSKIKSIRKAAEDRAIAKRAAEALPSNATRSYVGTGPGRRPPAKPDLRQPVAPKDTDEDDGEDFVKPAAKPNQKPSKLSTRSWKDPKQLREEKDDEEEEESLADQRRADRLHKALQEKKAKRPTGPVGGDGSTKEGAPKADEAPTPEPAKKPVNPHAQSRKPTVKPSAKPAGKPARFRGD